MGLQLGSVVLARIPSFIHEVSDRRRRPRSSAVSKAALFVRASSTTCSAKNLASFDLQQVERRW